MVPRALPPRFQVRCQLIGNAQERRAAIRALVAILLEQPQQDIDAPAAYVAKSGFGLDADAGQRPEPLPYRQLPELYSALEAERRAGDFNTGRARSPQTARVNARKKPTHPGRSQAASAPMAKKKEGRKQRSRPGTGGRQPREVNGTSTTATAQLQAALGEPTKVRTGQRGARSEIWERPDLTALISLLQDRPGAVGSAPSQQDEAPLQKQRVVLVNRLSSQEIQGGETIAGQVFDGLRTAMANNLDIAAVICATNYWSELTFEEREDFNWIFEQVELGQLDGVVFREPDRVARKQAIVHPFYDKCRRVGSDVYLASLGRKVDWESSGDVMHISLENALAEVEAKKIAKRMQEAKRRRWLEEGRGWPGCKRFGFRRNQETKYLEVDPEQWPYIEFIHNNYGRLNKGRKNGCKAVAEALAELGVDLSPEKIRRILLDPIYVDGTYTVRFKGEVVACEPIPLENPISRSTFQHNQEMLAAQKGSYTRVQPGTNFLNGIPVEHAACCDQIDPRTGRAPLLKVNNAKPGEPSYWHYGKQPKPCHGYRIPQRELEAAVIRKLLELADDEDIQEAWSAAVHVDIHADKTDGEELEISLELQRAELRQQVKNLEQEHERQVEQILELSRGGTEITATQRIVAERIEEDLGQRRRRLEVLENNAKRRAADSERSTSRSKEELSAALRAVLTESIPENPAHKIRRQALVECCLSKVVVHDVKTEDDDELSGYEVELFGPLVPGSLASSGGRLPISPLDAARHVLEAELRDQEGRASADNDQPSDSRSRSGGAPQQRSTSTQVPTYKEVLFLIRKKETPEGQRAEHDQRLLENPWPERFRGLGEPDTPAWRSPRFRVSTLSPKPSSLLPIADCHRALQDAASSLEPDEGLTFEAYERWYKADPEHRLSPWSMVRTARNLGMGFRELRMQAVPNVRVRRLVRRPDPWPFERCEDAVRRAVAEHYAKTNTPLNVEGYKHFRRHRTDLPAFARLIKVARNNGTSIGEMLKRERRAQGLELSPAEVTEAREAWCRRGLVDAASSLPADRPLTWTAYRAWYRADPDHRPSPEVVARVAATLGVTPSQFRHSVLPSLSGASPRRPLGYWTYDRCLEALRLAEQELAAQDKPLTFNAYLRLAAGREDLPSGSYLQKMARRRGMRWADLVQNALERA